MAKNVNSSPWIFDATGQMEGMDRTGAYPGLPGTIRTYGTFTAATSDVITMTEHGLGQADAYGGPVQVSSSGTLPTGLSASTDYWYRVIDRDTFKFYTTESAAQSDGTAVDITGTGSGTHTMNAYNVFNFPVYIQQIKVDTGDGGNFLLTEDSDGQNRILKLDNTPADDTLWVPINGRYRAIYVQTLPANASIEVYHGAPERL